MNFEQRLARLLHMDDATWARHANPWSVFTRATVFPVLILAIWSRMWLGGWSLGLVAIAIAWTWLNPRLFSRPQSTRNWASKSVLSERVWLNRSVVPVPDHHRRFPTLLNAIAAIGTLFILWGVIALAIWPTVLGLALTYLGKFWFLDRMVWLYTDMQDADPAYRRWLY